VQVFIVDAFTDRAFAGNPAAVCLGQGDEPWMQSVAAEFNLAETAFLAGAAGEYDLRWFTPLVEVDLCGHATLASAHVLWETGEAAEVLRFRTRSGVLTAERDGAGITLGLPADRAAAVTDTAITGPLTAALGVDADCPVLRGRDDLLVELSGQAAVRALRPDFRALAAIETRGVVVTAPGGAEGVDFVSRFFGPRVGIDEDPVTGSAHCLLGPYWAERLGRKSLEAAQLSARGGRLRVEVGPDVVRLTGSAITVVRGSLEPSGGPADAR
jgi:PhzF family phenazine biosynthesis protein